ncbi:hypothetical protein ROG8370_02594 [Roseovarius gaetbuli]|uniref:Uncharacterized protein n=1 Tax=Roseovarius gaetbuli TaxID=1356575 RepID=A0A1X6ZPM3_9RHOB|nr:hypothetical protein ROG8370_02594 [Roseovarius gaetbuli]
MTINRANILKPKLFEHGAASGQASHQLTRAARAFAHRRRQGGLESFGQRCHPRQRLAGVHPAEVRRHRADRRGDAHFIVVENDKQAAPLGARIVERLIGHADTDRAIADHGNRVARRLPHVAAHGKAERGADRGQTMRGAERIMGAFAAFGKARQPALLAQGTDAITPPGQDFMRVTLVAHVPDQLVHRRIEDRVNGNAQLDHPKA